MDIMNIMKVSSSKFTFTLIAVAALFVSGAGIMVQDAFAGVPTFTAITNSTTTTEVTFSEATNGTLLLSTWLVDGVEVTAATNGTNPSAANKLHAGGSETFGFLNNTITIKLTHGEITTGATPSVQYINPRTNDDAQDLYSGVVEPGVNNIVNATVTAVDGVIPTAIKAFTTSDRTFEIQFTEKVGIVNATSADFSITGYNYKGGAPNVATMTSGNNTDTIKFSFQNPIDFRDTFTLEYGNKGTHGTGLWITDATNSPVGDLITRASEFNPSNDGVGNRLANFTGLILYNYQTAVTNDDSCYDCSTPVIDEIQITISGETVTASTANPVHINAGLGDTISYTITLSDNKGGASIPYAGLYTDFVSDSMMGGFDNLFYTNNFDSLNQMSASYYEWNTSSDDIVYSSNTITWDEATATVDSATQSKTFTFTMTVNEAMESNEIWIDVADISGNYLKTSLPLTLEVTGNPSLTFASNDGQKVTSFFNESVLFALVSQWSEATDNSANTSELSTVLGIEESTLPAWTTSLATWAADDKIDVAEMIIAVEYVINQ